MELLIRNIKKNKDLALLREFARRMGFQANILKSEDLEDFLLGMAMKKAEKSKKYSLEEARKIVGNA